MISRYVLTWVSLCAYIYDRKHDRLSRVGSRGYEVQILSSKAPILHNGMDRFDKYYGQKLLN